MGDIWYKFIGYAVPSGKQKRRKINVSIFTIDPVGGHDRPGLPWAGPKINLGMGHFEARLWTLAWAWSASANPDVDADANANALAIAKFNYPRGNKRRLEREWRRVPSNLRRTLETSSILTQTQEAPKRKSHIEGPQA